MASAQTFTLSGVVSGGGSPINGATVEALNNGTTTVAGTSTTNAQGQYSIALPPAVYDLRVTPPAASGFGQETLQDVDMTASNQQVDVVLLANTGTVSGTVRGLNGAPIAGTTVQIYSYPTGQFLIGGSTDANGFYSLSVSANVVFVVVNRTGPAPAAPSGSWSIQRSNLTVGSGVVQDFDLPLATLTGNVTDAGGNPVANPAITSTGSGSTSSLFWSLNGAGTSTSGGTYTLTIFTGIHDFTVRPPAGTPLPTLVQRSVSITGDATRNFVLPATSSVTGVLRGYLGQPVPGATVRATHTQTGAELALTTTAADGTYTLANVPTGTVHLQFTRSGGPAGIAPNNSWNLNRVNVAVSGTLALDVDLPVVQISGTTTTAAGAPIANATINLDSSGSDPQGSWSSSSFMTTPGSPAGVHSLLLFRGTANFLVRPPAGTGSAALVERNVTLTANLARDFVLPDAMTLSGVVRGIGGQPVQGAQVQAVLNGFVILNATTGANGVYTMGVPPGTLTQLTFTRGTLSPVAPNSWTYRRFNIPIAGPTTLDVSLDVIRLNGTAVDSNGAPVPSVNISPSTSRSQTGGDNQDWFSNAGVNTNSAGAYSILLLTGTTGSITIRPPTNSGFSQVTLNPVVFANNFTQRIVLQRPDTTAPVIVGGPAVLHLSDTSVSIGWTTNEPSTSFVDYGLGTLDQQAGSGALVTNHTVTLQNLVPHEIYSFRVFSRDANNNGPTQSGTDFFTMLPPPGDVTPPTILGGPVATFTGDTSVIIQWVTNEPASSLVRWGTSPDALDNVTTVIPGQFVTLHARVLGGLTPSTDYFARVETADPDANGIQSSVFTFRTAAGPDIQAPVITTAPSVVARTHNSATIRWTTDEAATSGVSYNDGAVFNLTNSDALNTAHEIVLAGLAANRTYSYTVASKDATGNGPTLAGPFTFMTLAAPDVTPPPISDVSVTPTKNTAAVVWTTASEASTTVVRFGTVSGALDRIVSDLSLQFSHQVTLTGLLPGTTYFYSLRSTDAAGNTTNATEASFDTLPDDVNTPPTPPAPVTASPNPSRTGTFTITWGAPTDDGPGGVKEVEVLRNDEVVSPPLAPSETSYLISGAAEGSHTYRIRARDFSDATSISDPITVVVDLTSPTLNLPSPITTPATTNTDAIVNYTVTATDNIDPNPVVTCSPPSGNAYPIGTTTVSCTGRDAAGNVTPGSFTVTVTDPFAPILTVPGDISLQAENQNGAVVTFTVTATDNHDPAPVVTCTPPSGSVFPVGFTSVICTATDASNNTASRSFTVAIGAPPKVASSIALASSSPDATFGQPITFTATVTGTDGSTPSGNVQFLDGTTVIGQTPLTPPAGGSGSPAASLTIATLGAGTRSITVSYAGDLGHEPSTSAAIAVEIAKAQPTIAVTGGTFVYNAAPRVATGTVTGVDNASIGTLTFTYDGSPEAPVAAGAYAVVGSFAGNDNYEPGSANVTLTIGPGPTQITVQPGPAIVFGQPATISASVTSPTGEVPQGSVEFFDGTTSLGTAALNAAGTAQVVASSLGVGSHTISAVYSGGGNFGGSSSGAGLQVTHVPTTTALSVTPNPAGFLEPFRLVATVAVTPPGAGAPAGVVEFFNGTTALGAATLNLVSGVPTAVLTMNGFPPASYQITARYTGNASLAPSTSNAVTQVVRGAESSTWTVLTISPATSSRVNTNVTLRAVVVPLAGSAVPTGLVQFYAWGSPIGSPVPLTNVGGAMTATLVTAALPSGLMQLRAYYTGSGAFSPSLSIPVSHTVFTTAAPVATVTSVTLSPSPLLFGQSLTVTAAVTSGGGATPGYLLLAVDGIAAQALPVVSGSPTTFTVAGLGRGLHGITVQFIPTTTALAGSLSHMFAFVQ